MDVVLDARMAFHTGIGRYIRNLSRGLLDHAGVRSLSLFVDPGATQRVHQEIGPVRTIPLPARIYSLAEQVHGLRVYRTQAQHASLFHCPHYNIPWFLPRNSVVTVHDLTHFVYPQYFGKYRVALAFYLLRRVVQRAGHIITVSQATQKELETMFPEAKGKITVVHHAIDEIFNPLPPAAIDAFKQRYKLRRFFLYLGNCKPHKNLQRVLQAFAQFREMEPQMELVLLGVSGSELSRSIEGVRPVTDITDEQLVGYYNAAEALLFPSLNEGFGLPPLEAMACGTPVIGSDIAVMREVTGEAALLVDPENVGDLAQAMRQVATRPEYGAWLRCQGLARARHFTLAATAHQTFEVYTQVAHELRAG